MFLQTLLLCAAPLVLNGCSSETASRPAQTHPSLTWNLSTSRDAIEFPWYDFDPVRGAIDDPYLLTLKFDENRQFKGNTELVVFSRKRPDAGQLSSVSINLPPMNRDEVSKKLWQLAREWSLPTEKLRTQLPKMLVDRTRRGILLSERENPTIDVELVSSFDDDRPYSITISWYWRGESSPPSQNPVLPN